MFAGSLAGHNFFERCGFLLPLPTCLEAPCPFLGVALAVIEIDRYIAASALRRDVGWLLEAQTGNCLTADEREWLVARGHWLQLDPLLDALDSRTGGRPARPLARAVAQHLAGVDFSEPEVADLMGNSAEAIRKRCAGREARWCGFVPMFLPLTDRRKDGRQGF
ncbi:MAG TPA: hypothetical protein VHP33_36255 [Polyangiaceae bacterium]|nr:hypothetical protein [Polyangiaceae bacterium]